MRTWSLISLGGCAKIQNPTNRVQKGWICMVNMLSKGTRQAFTRNSLTNYENICYFHTSHGNSGVLSVTAKFLCHLDTLHFNIITLDQDQSPFWRFCEFLMCTIAMIQLSDPVIFSGIAASRKYSTIPVWGKSCFDLCGCVQVLWHRMMPNSSYCTSKDIPQKQNLWYVFFNEIFCPECDVEVAWWHEASLH